MRIIFLWVLGICFLQSYAQRPIQLSVRGALILPTGFYPVTTNDAMYFGAFDQNKGWQVFMYDGVELRVISKFKHVYETKKVIEAKSGGAMVSKMVAFQNSVIFHVKGKTIESGLYRIEGESITKLLSGIEDCSNPVIFENHLVMEITYTDDMILYKRTVSIDSDWVVTKGKKTTMRSSDQLATETLVFGNEILGISNGKLVTWTENGFQLKTPKYTHVQNPIVMGNQLFFTGLKKGTSEMLLYSIRADGGERAHGNIFPGKNMMTAQKPFMLGDYTYFIADADAKGMALYRLNSDTVGLVSKFEGQPGMRDARGITGYDDQLFISVCGIKGSGCDLMQYNGKSMTQRNPSYLNNVQHPSVLKDRLVYLASEMGINAVYTSEPILPPTITSDTFTIFDYWQNGDLVGQVQATDGSGKLRYYIVEGNDSRAFEIDYFSGEIKVSDKSKLKSLANPVLLKVKVENRQDAVAYAVMYVEIKKGKRLDVTGLQETLLFFPDFTKKRTLTTKTLKEGQLVGVYNMDFVMVDELKVRQKAILLGSYPPGIYLLHVKNEKNLYQKIELH